MYQTFKSVLHKVKHYCHTHDDIEMLLLSCMLGSGWMAYHAITGIIERIT